MKKFWENYKFSFTLLLGIFAGALIGVVMGEKATVLEPIGQIFLNLMFTIVVPMVFVSIASSVGSMLNMKRLGKILGSMVGTFIVTGLFAAAIVLVVVNVLSPAANTNIAMEATEMGEMQSVSDMIVGSLTVDDFTGLLSRKNMLPIIIAAILTGLAVAKCGGEESPFGKLLANMNQVIMKLIEMIMKFAPIGLGAYFANLVGKFGPQLIGDYGRCMAIYYPMCLLYGFIFFPLYAWFAAGKKGVTVMAKKSSSLPSRLLPPRVPAQHCLSTWKPAMKSVSPATSATSCCRLAAPCTWTVRCCPPSLRLPSCTAFLVCPTPVSAPMLCQLPSLS